MKIKKPKTSAAQYVSCGWRRAWIMWDLDNGHAWSSGDPGRGYMWVFKTRKEAMEHRRIQHQNPKNVRLSLPFKIEGDRSMLLKAKDTKIQIWRSA